MIFHENEKYVLQFVAAAGAEGITPEGIRNWCARNSLDFNREAILAALHKLQKYKLIKADITAGTYFVTTAGEKALA